MKSYKVREILEPFLPGREFEEDCLWCQLSVSECCALGFAYVSFFERPVSKLWRLEISTQGRLCRWPDRVQWERLLEIPVNQPDFEWLNAVGIRGGNPDIARTKEDSPPRDIWPWMSMAF